MHVYCTHAHLWLSKCSPQNYVHMYVCMYVAVVSTTYGLLCTYTHKIVHTRMYVDICFKTCVAGVRTTMHICRYTTYVHMMTQFIQTTHIYVCAQRHLKYTTYIAIILYIKSRHTDTQVHTQVHTHGHTQTHTYRHTHIDIYTRLVLSAHYPVGSRGPPQ